MAANFTLYTIKSLNKIPTISSQLEKDLLLFRNRMKMLIKIRIEGSWAACTVLLKISKVDF